jgi:heterodisulfide reductase subunit A-like polyferredoxin
VSRRTTVDKALRGGEDERGDEQIDEPTRGRGKIKMGQDLSGSRPGQVAGSVMVVGGGIAGMQAALDIANSGFYVYLVEKAPAIGGVMAGLDKTFPTNDCAM